MKRDKPFWDQFDGSALFLERGFIEEGWTLATALAQFKERYGQAASPGSLRVWWRGRLDAMGHEVFLRRITEHLTRCSAALEETIRGSGTPGLRAIAALLSEIVLNLGTALRLSMASGSFKPEDAATQNLLKLVNALADKAVKAGQEAGRQQERTLKLRELEIKLAAAAPPVGKAGTAGEDNPDRVISQETLEKIERELGLL